ncbi:MAG: ATP-dependent helicase [Candidatus Buchananbacteria bacterium]
MVKYVLRAAPMAKDFKIDYAKELNEDQYKVVTEGYGPCLVLAGAGSGKTRTLVYRVVYLLEQGVPASSIMLVTFTNKAAKEMLERIEVLLHGEAKGLWGGTFHHLGNRLLRMYGERINIANNFTILDEEDSLTLLKNCLSRSNPPEDKYFPKAKVIRSIISLSQNLCQPIREVIAARYDYLKDSYLPCILEAADLYKERKTQINALDFDDLLIKWNELLEQAPEIKKRLGEKFAYILIDEFQDTNALQSKIIANLAAPQRNILAVGDDAQSIYGFRGADVNHILDFPKQFPDAKILRLEINYRSTPEILALADTSINHNDAKFEKHLKAIRAKGAKPAVAALTDNYQQAEFVCQRILDLQREDGLPLNSMAVLFRSHFQCLELEMELNKRNIPYQMRGGLRFFEQAHLKDILAYLKILANFRDEVSWLRLLSMQGGIGEMTAEKIWQWLRQFDGVSSIFSTSSSVIHDPSSVIHDPSSVIHDPSSVIPAQAGIQHNNSTWIPDQTRNDISLGAKAASGWSALKRTLEKIARIDKNDLPALVTAIIDSGYEKYLQANYENFQDRLDDLTQLTEFVKSYDSLERFLADTALSENFQGQSRAPRPENGNEQIILSTIHQAKGLEWPAVFVIGLAEGMFPHAKVYDKPEELEEERRLFYVACTRAKDQLYLSYPLFGRDSMLHPSQFIKELPSKLYDRWDVEAGEDEVIYVDEEGERASGPGKRKGILDFDPELEIEESDY